MSEMIVRFHHDERGIARSWDEVGKLIRCKDCKWCSEHYDTDGNVPYWVCNNWDAGTDADGFCHEAELRGDDDVPESIT